MSWSEPVSPVVKRIEAIYHYISEVHSCRTKIDSAEIGLALVDS